MLNQLSELNKTLMILGALLLLPNILPAHSAHHEVKTADKEVLHFTEKVPIEVQEKTGEKIPLDLMFKDETGKMVVLGELIQQPTLLLPAFFYCVTDCGVQLSFLATGIKDLGGISFNDFRVITLSFDPGDNTTTAMAAKKNYIPLVGTDFPEANWQFLTGEFEQIQALLTAIGYSVRQTKKHVFDHPNALIVLGADGKIIRYLYGPRFLPFDIGMAITEAQSGRTGSSIRKMLSYCVEYDAEQQRYSFQYIRIFGIFIPLLLLLFYLLFLRKGNQPQFQQIPHGTD